MTARARQCPLCEERVTVAEMCPIHAVPTIDASMFEHAPVPISVGTVVAHRYRVERILDVGGMGTVLIAAQLGMNRTIALKILRGQQAVDMYLVRRFYREAQAISSLNHPNVVQVFDFGFDQTVAVPFLAMELVEGRTLDELVRTGKMTEKRISNILAQVSRALFEAHAKGIIHRDLKPANIMVTRMRDGDEHVKVLDFGVAKILSADREGLTAPGSTVGSPHYMSPEQARADKVDYRSDLYSLGCVLFEAVTGHVPFDADRTFDVMRMQVLDRAPPLPQRLVDGKAPTRALREILDALLAKAQEDRPANAGVVARIFGSLARGEPIDVQEALRAERESGHMHTPRGTTSAIDEQSTISMQAVDPSTDREGVAIDPSGATYISPPPRGMDPSVSVDTAPHDVANSVETPVAPVRNVSARMRIQNLSTRVPPQGVTPSGPEPKVETVETPLRPLPSPPQPVPVAVGTYGIVEVPPPQSPFVTGSGDLFRPPTSPLVQPVREGRPWVSKLVIGALAAIALVGVGVVGAMSMMESRPPAPETQPLSVPARDHPTAEPVRAAEVAPAPDPTPVVAQRPSAQTETPPPPPPVQPPRKVRERVRPAETPSGAAMVVIASEPPGAEIVREGAVIGRTPMPLARPKGADAVHVTLRLKGYVERRVEIGANAGNEVRVKLPQVWE